MSTVKISKEFVRQAVQAAMDMRVPIGGSKVNVVDIEVVAADGTIFEADAFQVTSVRRAPAITAPKRTPPAGLGKIRLAAVDGVAK